VSLSPITALEQWRAELDAIDATLLDTLRTRIECCIAIAEIKRAGAIPMMQPGRIALVQERAARYADEHGLDREFLQSLYTLIIAETCRVETLVIDGEATCARS
jgi:chorismate mutase